MPDVIALQEDQGGPALGIEYRLDVTPERAAQMNWDLAERLVSRDLDLPGVAVSFLGVKIEGGEA